VGDEGVAFTDTFGGSVLVEMSGHQAQISREEIAALAILFPVRGESRSEEKGQLCKK
jgi:hypothetical protein